MSARLLFTALRWTWLWRGGEGGVGWDMLQEGGEKERHEEATNNGCEMEATVAYSAMRKKRWTARKTKASIEKLGMSTSPASAKTCMERRTSSRW